MNPRILISTCALAFSAAMAPQASAVVLVAWDFGGKTGSEATVEATTVIGGFLSGSITRGPGLTVTSPVTNTFTSQGWNLGTDEAAAHAAGDYIDITLTPGPEVTSWSISSISARMLTTGSSSPHLVSWRYSRDNFADWIVLFDMGEFPSGTVVTQTSILSGSPLLQNITGAITLRFVCYDADLSTAHLDFGFGSNDGNDLTVNGTFVPEPGASSLLMVGALGLGWARRRRRLSRSSHSPFALPRNVARGESGARFFSDPNPNQPTCSSL